MLEGTVSLSKCAVVENTTLQCAAVLLYWETYEFLSISLFFRILFAPAFHHGSFADHGNTNASMSHIIPLFGANGKFLILHNISSQTPGKSRWSTDQKMA